MSEPTREEKLNAIDAAIDRAAETWKRYVRENDGVLAEFYGRRNEPLILRPVQK